MASEDAVKTGRMSYQKIGAILGMIGIVTIAGFILNMGIAAEFHLAVSIIVMLSPIFGILILGASIAMYLNGENKHHGKMLMILSVISLFFISFIGGIIGLVGGFIYLLWR